MAKCKEIERDMDWGDLSSSEIAVRVVENGCRKVILEADATGLPENEMSNFVAAIKMMRGLYEKIVFAYDEDHIRCADEISMKFQYKKGTGGGCAEKAVRYLG